MDEITNANDTVLSGNGVPCRMLSVAERIAANAVFVCMLVEGVYLHRLIVAVFRQKLKVKLLYVVGAGKICFRFKTVGMACGRYDGILSARLCICKTSNLHGTESIFFYLCMPISWNASPINSWNLDCRGVVTRFYVCIFLYCKSLL